MKDKPRLGSYWQRGLKVLEVPGRRDSPPHLLPSPQTPEVTSEVPALRPPSGQPLLTSFQVTDHTGSC